MGKMHGCGVQTWSDGRKYDGEYFNGRKQGTGTFTFATGRKYVGQWHDGKQHGFGVSIENGIERQGVWKEGQVREWFVDLK